MKNNKGITTTSLIITIIVMIILAGIALFFTVDSGVINKAQRTQFLEDMKLYKEELELYKGEKQIQNQRENKPLDEGINPNVFTDIWGNQGDGLKPYIPSIKNKYNDILLISEAELAYYFTGDWEERKWAEAAGLKIIEQYAKLTVEILGQGIIEGLPASEDVLVRSTVNLEAKSTNIQVNGENINYHFVGWYDKDGKLIYEGAKYEFIISGDKHLVAKFVTDVTVIYYLDASGEEQKFIDKNAKISKADYENEIGVNQITKLEIGEICKEIAVGAFSGCENLKRVEALGKNQVKVNAYDGKAFNPPFENCTSLEILILPNVDFNAASWNANQFSGCTALTTARLGSVGNPVNGITARAFQNCLRNDLKIKVYVKSGVTKFNHEPFGAINATIEYYDATTGELLSIRYGKEYQNNTEIDWTELPDDNITTITEGAFQGCTNLALTKLPENIVTIQKDAFKGCSNIKISQIPESCTSIGPGAFSGCTGITRLEASSKNKLTINSYDGNVFNSPFENCTALETLILPNVSFGEGWNCNHFAGCTSLKEVQLGSKGNPVLSIPSRAFQNCLRNDLKIKIYAQSGTINFNNEPWGATNATIEYYDATTGELMSVRIGKEYMGNTAITWTELPNADKITKIGDSAFYGCTNLALTSLPQNLVIIGKNAFRDCSNIKISQIPESCTTIGAGAFINCKKITKIEAGSKNKLLLACADNSEKTEFIPQFKDCTSLQTLILPNVDFNSASWNANQFSGCTALTTVQLGSVGNPVTGITARAFQNCTQSNLNITIYKTAGTTFSRQPFGATNATIVYKDAATGEVIE